MTYSYSETKKDYVLESLGKGYSVVLADFQAMKMLDCGNLTVNAINSYMARNDVKFYKGTPNE